MNEPVWINLEFFLKCTLASCRKNADLVSIRTFLTWCINLFCFVFVRNPTAVRVSIIYGNIVMQSFICILYAMQQQGQQISKTDIKYGFRKDKVYKRLNPRLRLKCLDSPQKPDQRQETSNFKLFLQKIFMGAQIMWIFCNLQ